MVHRQDSSEKQLGDLRAVVAALPQMPRNIVDDTRHEKVLSYVSAFIAQGDPTLMATMLSDWGILNTISTCLAPDQDYRISCVALRILGYLLEYEPVPEQIGNDATDTPRIWTLLESKHPTILTFLLQNILGEEALTRYSCWFALERIGKNDGGAQWLLQSGNFSEMVRAALKDSSTFVLAAVCQFLVAVIENRSIDPLQTTAHDALLDSLLVSISLLDLIQSMVTDKSSETNRLAGLEFLWMLANSRSARSAAFLRQSRLFNMYMDLLLDDSRLVRARALEILSILLESAEDPLGILGEAAEQQEMELDRSHDEALVQCYKHLMDVNIVALIEQEKSLKAIHVATGILDAMVKPLRHSEEMHGHGKNFKDSILTAVLWMIDTIHKGQSTDFQDNLNYCSPPVVKGDLKLAKLLNSPELRERVLTLLQTKQPRSAGTLPRMIIMSSLKALQILALNFPTAVEQSDAIQIVLSILLDQKMCSDQRVFKACLATIPIMLKSKVQNEQLLDEPLFLSTMETIIGLIHRPSNGSSSLRLILVAVQEFFMDPTLGMKLVQEKIGQTLANSLGRKLYDMEWDVRDNVVEFIGNLFNHGGPDSGVEWALKHDLLELVFQKLSDEEAYVRAASIHAFEIIMRDARGWKNMCSEGLEARLSTQLPILIRDSEAFVRRAVLEAMICLVSERESGIILMVNGTDLFVDAVFMSRLTLDDADWEVRIRACEFLAAVWEHCVALDEKADYRSRASKRMRDSDFLQDEPAPGLLPSTWWFYDIKGDKILVEATQDSSRLVRRTSVEILKKMKKAIESRMDPLLREKGKDHTVAPVQTQVLAGEKEALPLQERHDPVRKRGADESDDRTVEGVDPITGNSENKNSGQKHPHADFYAVLKGLDFVRLDATTSLEQLYEEVLNVEKVEDVVMAETEDANFGNNVLDCY
ncbi:BRCA1-associated ATM activator 1 [Lunasporangiospora selenospora]|uniref:BRCA1-associated ATM activator 1 n=1 Tax=Lunasporangiospora selenospora TaxID=979761 RepID=A0A9P6G111_9FUNG|nr:BRCA1-associated ATM activator 1 [Lunasporangiospora selenospora]